MTRDTITDSGYQPSTDRLSWPHRVTGPFPILFVGILGQPVAADPAALFFASVRFAGLPLTHVADGGSSERWAHLWKLPSPPTGEHLVEIAMAGTSDAQAMAASYTDASAGDLGAAGGGSEPGAHTTIGTTPLVTLAPAWLVGCMRMSGDVAPSPTGAVQVWARSGGFFFYDSLGEVPAGSHALTFDTSGPVHWGSASGAVLPHAGGGPTLTASRLALLGVG